MRAEITTWVATAVGSPIVLVTLCWTIVIYHYHRKQWQSTDLLVVAILVQGVVKQISTFCYTIMTLLQPVEYHQSYCFTLTWLLTSIHLLQAGTLTTLIVTRLFVVRYPDKYKHVVKRTHLIYHLISLSALSACIGIAAVLAEPLNSGSVINNENTHYIRHDDKKRFFCTFLPHELDERFAILSITIHSFLNIVSIIVFMATSISWCLRKKIRKAHDCKQRQLLLTSSSDLSAMSDLSLGSANMKEESLSVARNSNYHNGNRLLSFAYGDKMNMENCSQRNIPKKERIGRANHTHTKTTEISTSSYPVHKNAMKPNELSSPLGNNEFHSVQSTTNFPFTIHGSSSDTYKITNHNNTGPKSLTSCEGTFDKNYYTHGHTVNENGCRWTSEPSYMSTSTSSTNSRAPCIARQSLKQDKFEIPTKEWRLSTAISVLGLCSISNHLPVLVFSVIGTFVPWIVPESWPLPLLYLWAGLVEECLLPIILAMFDDNFTTWVANIYTRDRKLLTELARHHQGLDGKFRVFNSPVPEIQHQHHTHQTQPEQIKFPITNGSLFTTVDGRLPVLHNYRRGKVSRAQPAVPPHCINKTSSTTHLQGNMLHTFLNDNSSNIAVKHAECRRSKSNECGNISTDTQVFQSFQEHSRNKNCIQNVDSINSVLSDLEVNSQNETGDFEDLNSELNEYEVGNEPIYATLSSRSCCSATTAANDDFEFYQNDNNMQIIKDKKMAQGSIQEMLNNIVHIRQEGQGNEKDELQSTQNQHKYFDVNNLHPEESVDPLLSCKCQGISHSCGKNKEHNDLLNIILPLIQDLQNKEPGISNYSCESKFSGLSPMADKILKTVIENDRKRNNKTVVDYSIVDELTHKTQNDSPKMKKYHKTVINTELVPENNLSKMRNLVKVHVTYENDNVRDKLEDENKSELRNQVYRIESRSLSNLDDMDCELLNISSDESSWGKYRRSSNIDKQKLFTPSNEKYMDENQVIFQYPVKSESTLNMYHMHQIDNIDECSLEDVKFRNSRQFLTQGITNYSLPNDPAGISKRSCHRTPPTRRFHKHRKMLPVLSVESLTTALSQASVSYLDNGDLYQHGREFSGSEPDFKRVFVSDYL